MDDEGAASDGCDLNGTKRCASALSATRMSVAVHAKVAGAGVSMLRLDVAAEVQAIANVTNATSPSRSM